MVDVKNVVLNVVAYYVEIGSMKKKVHKRSIMIKDIWKNLPAWFFDRACSHRKCGCCTSIVIELGIYYHF